MFLPNCFIVLAFTFSSIILYELIFYLVWGRMQLRSATGGIPVVEQKVFSSLNWVGTLVKINHKVKVISGISLPLCVCVILYYLSYNLCMYVHIICTYFHPHTSVCIYFIMYYIYLRIPILMSKTQYLLLAILCPCISIWILGLSCQILQKKSCQNFDRDNIEPIHHFRGCFYLNKINYFNHKHMMF